MFGRLLLLALTISPVSALAKNAEAPENSESFLAVAIFTAIALYLMLKTLRFIWRYRYPKCKKWWALREEKRELLGTDIETITKQEEIKDNNGNVLRVEDVKIPVIVYHYEVWRKCKHCEHHLKTLEDEQGENK